MTLLISTSRQMRRKLSTNARLPFGHNTVSVILISIHVLFTTSRHMLSPIHLSIITTILAFGPAKPNNNTVTSQPSTSHPLPPLPLPPLITHPPQQRCRSQRRQSHITIDANIHSLSMMARQRPMRVRTIRRRHVVEHGRQNREFGIRFPRSRSLSIWLRASCECCGQWHGVAEDQQHESQCD
jgi:hypothetical protein